MKDNRLTDCAAYERPAFEILEFAVESGFQLSGGNEDPNYDLNGQSDAGMLEDGGSI